MINHTVFSNPKLGSKHFMATNKGIKGIQAHFTPMLVKEANKAYVDAYLLMA